MNANPEFAKSKLNDASHAKDRARRAAWLTLVIALLLLITLTVALVDYWWLLPRGARLAGFGLLAAILTAGIARLVRLLRRPASFKEVALDVEAQDPALGCTISTAAEYLSGTRQIVHEYEPGLVAALESQAGAMLAPVSLPYWRKLLFPAALCLAGFLVFLGFLLSTSGALTALSRTANPWSSAAYTRIEVKTGNLEIAVGRDVAITGAFHGRPPRDPQFQWREGKDAPWQSAALTPAADGAFTNSLKEVRSDLAYRVAGGDAVSSEYRITTYLPAAVKDLRIRLDFPTYTGLKPVTQSSPNITALRGSTASFTLLPNVKLSQARLVSDKAPPTDLTPGPDNSWTGALALAKDANYRIELRDEKNRPGLNERTNHIKVIADQPPKVEIVEPGQDTRAEATNAVALKITASDDFGVADLRLIYHKLGGPEKILPVRQVGREGNEIQGAVDLPLKPLGLKEFELVAYHVEARDNNTLDGPGVGKSPLYFIEITRDGASKTNPPPKPQPGSKVNLIVIQKQIVADTRALANQEPAEKFKDLAVREQDAAGFGQLYLASMTSGGAPPAALTMMASAMNCLTNATTALEARQRDTALPPEEQALANLYQVLKLVPELESMPLQPPTNSVAKTNPPPSKMVQVVLEAIKEQKQQQPDDKEIAAMLEEAQQLSRDQASINHLGLQAAKAKGAAGSPQSGRQAKAGQAGEDQESKPADAKDGKEGQLGKDGKDGQAGQGKDGKASEAKNGKDGEGKNGKDGKGQDGKDGQGKDGKGGQGKDGKGGKGKDGKGGQGKDGQGGQDGKGGQGKDGKGGQGKNGNPQDGKDGKTDDNPDAKDQEDVENPATDLAKAAEKQEELSQEASEMADKLEHLAGKDARLGHGIVKAMAKAKNNMKAAAESLKGGNGSGGSAHGSQAVYDLNTVAAMLQQVLEASGQLSDVSNEDYPAEFEVAIREYLKRLSYQE